MIKLSLILLLLVKALSGHAAGEDSCENATDTSRVVAAGGSIAEMLIALNAEDLLVAVDSTARYLPQAIDLPSIGYVRNLSAEGILTLKPSVIIGEHDMGPNAVVDQLSMVDVEIRRIQEDHTTQGIIDKFFCIAKIVDRSETASAVLLDQFDKTIQKLAETPAAPRATSQRVMLILNFVDHQPIVAGANTSGDGILKMAGAHNIFSDIDGWKPISRELLSVAQPDHIVLTKRALESIGGINNINADPLLASTAAVKNGNVHAFQGMSLLGFGLQTLDVALQLKEAIE
ncbi:MAG: hypothetical protein CME46_07640 [Halieaceae bacterium]|nr:hypothetical protein [Halieaceae bacterium]MDG1932410.1 ABC transporter substrate-binding protein [Luminiphilus sp.]MDG2037291.1 ABC transporter substrate-binding protein [Luminiphilus sp.]|tara:strand:+ start:657 stop:1520 length:864 start_codon:yes stop_codon:yes gene_type:complete